MHHLLAGANDTGFVITAAALQSPVPDPKAYSKQIRAITVGEQVPQRSVLTSLIDNGYTRYETSLEPGGVLVRGDQITLMHPLHDHTTTLTWLGGVIEAITTTRGTRSKSTRNASLLPVRFPDASVPLASLLESHLVCRPMHAVATGHPTIIYDALESDIAWPLPAAPLSRLPEHDLFVWYTNRDRVESYLADHGLTGSLCVADVAASPFVFMLDDNIVVSEAMLIPATTKTIRPLTRAKGLELLAELTVGRPAVHSDHGIGIYEGLETRTLVTDAREYLLLRYAAGDTLSVPVEYAHKVTPYIGEESPPIHRLGGAGWTKVRAQARADAEAFAKELLETAGQRTTSQGHTYELAGELDEQLDTTFPFSLTPDQERTWADVRDDLVSDTVMDRLIVGDVGFGKTPTPGATASRN
jgi:transcription-repair coupling factor (superfamily II helicase)